MIYLVSTLSQLFVISFLAFGPKPPEAVWNAFEKKFPDAVEVKWDKVGDHNFEAMFYIEDKRYAANFTEKGKWVETKTFIDFEELPEKVVTTLDKNHPNAKIREVCKTETSLGKIKYGISIKKGLKTDDLIFTDMGKEVSR